MRQPVTLYCRNPQVWSQKVGHDLPYRKSRPHKARRVLDEAQGDGVLVESHLLEKGGA